MSMIPYVRPLELGTNTFEQYVRVVQDGTRTVAEVYSGKQEDHYDGKLALGVGHSVRRKGERRRPEIGTTLAIARAFESVAKNSYEGVEKALNGSLTA